MRLSLRFIVPLGIALAAIAYAVVPLVDRLTLQWFVRDLEIRSTTIANAAQEPLTALVREPRARQKVLRYFERIIQDERIFAIGFCDLAGKMLYATNTFPESVRCPQAGKAASRSRLVQLERGPLHVSVNPVSAEGEALGELVIVHDMSFVQRRSADTKKYIFYLFAAIAAVVALITVVIAEISWRGWVAGIKGLISGEMLLGAPDGLGVTAPELRPIAKDLQALVRDLEAERHARDESQILWGPNALATWSPEMLRGVLREKLLGDEILVVSNREPFLHVQTDEGVVVQRPASGLVTALEPVMRACSGTWIAHGGGSADRDTVDRQDHVMVPPEKPSYRIRRVWLSKEEEQGYYYGLA
ncbi:MAG: trehalose-6-phosphate synthase, partial [Betaproteobacteria bacterium]